MPYEHHFYFTTLCSFIVWSDDTWLQEHAGKTIDEKEEEEEEKGTKRSALLSQTVSFHPSLESPWIQRGERGSRPPPPSKIIFPSKRSRP